MGRSDALVSDRAWAGLAWAACAGSITLFVVGVVVPAATNPYTNGFAGLYVQSKIVIEHPRDLARLNDDAWFQRQVDQSMGRHIEETGRGQPPTTGLIALPVGWLSPARARLVWTVISVFLWIAGLKVFADALSLRPFRGIPPVLWLTAATTLYRPIAENLARGQGYTLMFLLLCVAMRSAMRSPRSAVVGVPLGLMLILKSAGLWFCPLLAVGRRWRIIASAVATVMLVALFLTALAGAEAWRVYFSNALVDMYREPSKHVTAYQTLQSLFGHLFVYERLWNPWVVADAPALAAVLDFAVIGGVFVVSVRRQRIDSDRIGERALTIGMFIAPIVAVAPIGEGYHYVMVLPAVLIAWWWAFKARTTRRDWLILVLCTALICVPQRIYGSTLLRSGWTAVLAYPRVYGSLILWAVLARVLGPRRRDP